MNGEEILIAEAGKPVTRLAPYASPVPKRTPGKNAGKVVIAPDFGEPLPEYGNWLPPTRLTLDTQQAQ